MSCPTTKCLCDKLVISQSVAFTDNQLVITIPDGTYGNNCKYCIVIAQDIPTTTTIAANVVIQIGTATTIYPLVNCDCTNVIACQINSRTRYSTKVHTNIQSGVFKLLGPANCCKCRHGANSLPISTTTSSTEVSE